MPRPRAKKSAAGFHAAALGLTDAILSRSEGRIGSAIIARPAAVVDAPSRAGCRSSAIERGRVSFATHGHRWSGAELARLDYHFLLIRRRRNNFLWINNHALARLV